MLENTENVQDRLVRAEIDWDDVRRKALFIRNVAQSDFSNMLLVKSARKFGSQMVRRFTPSDAMPELDNILAGLSASQLSGLEKYTGIVAHLISVYDFLDEYDLAVLVVRFDEMWRTTVKETIESVYDRLLELLKEAKNEPDTGAEIQS